MNYSHAGVIAGKVVVALVIAWVVLQVIALILLSTGAGVLLIIAAVLVSGFVVYHLLHDSTTRGSSSRHSAGPVGRSEDSPSEGMWATGVDLSSNADSDSVGIGSGTGQQEDDEFMFDRNAGRSVSSGVTHEFHDRDEGIGTQSMGVESDGDSDGVAGYQSDYQYDSEY